MATLLKPCPLPLSFGSERHYRLLTLLFAGLLVLLVQQFTPSIAPHWDAAHYINMAQYGSQEGAHLKAPFAYRPLIPLAARLLAGTLDVSVELAFQWIVLGSGWLLLASIAFISRHFSGNAHTGWGPMIFLAFSPCYLKGHFVHPFLLDLPASTLMLWACAALLKRRVFWCSLFVLPGLLTKEFLAVPWILLCMQTAFHAWRTRSLPQALGSLFLFVLGCGLILLPRLFIEVSSSSQFIDPVNRPETLSLLTAVWGNTPRLVNVVYALLLFWLPTGLLCTRQRCRDVLRQMPLETRLLLVALCGLVGTLTLYGGSNIFIFVHYMIAAQVVLLGLLFTTRLPFPEVAAIAVFLFVFHKTAIPIPDPDQDFEGFLDFFGAWGSRIAPQLNFRFGIALTALLVAAVLRRVLPSGRRPTAG